MRQVLTQTETLLGQALQGRYRVEREIGRGGMATVCLAHDLRYDRPVAIKVLHRELAAMIGADRFRREVAITARLDHPNILALLDDGDIDGLPYYVMPFVEGESLAERLDREHQLPVEEALLIAREVADALAYAHGQGIIHRDIKPENILLSKGHAFVADFGIARALQVTGGDRITESGMAVGTPAYMSPEQATASDDVDGRTDIYSLGCVLYEMLAGMPPFVGPTPQAVLARHMSMEMAPAIRTVRVTISQSLEGVVMKALAKVPADRFATAAELRDLLGRPDTFEIPVQAIRSRRPIWVAAAAVVLAAVGFLGWRATRGDAGSLRTDKIVVFPLVTPGQASADATVGEDIAIIIGHTVDGTGTLRWFDGWTLLTEEQRGRMRGVSLGTQRRLARSSGSARYLTGTVFVYPDSVQVLLALHDVAGDSIVARSAESVLLDSEGAWREEAVRAGLLAVNGLLPALIPVGSPDVVDEWMDRNPAAIADFLAAEQLFRRAQPVEALEFYRKSIDADPQFSFAAVRGSQAAIWAHDLEAIAALVQPILDHPEGVPPEYLHFAQGLDAFANGQADRAVRELREALVLDPEFGEAWMQLGETYTHLLPNEPNPDSLANEAFERAYALDPSGTNVLFHLIQQAVRTGDTTGASAMADAFLAADPDPQLAREVDILVSCSVRGPESEDWQGVRREAPSAGLNAAKAFGWAVLPCAGAAHRAVLGSGSFSWYSEVGLVSMHLVQGRAERAMQIIDSIMIADTTGSSLYLVAAAFGAGAVPQLRDRAEEILAEERARYGDTYERLTLPYLLWEIGVLEARLGNVPVARAVLSTLVRLEEEDDADTRLLGMLADAVAAHVAVAEADTAAAIELLQALAPTGNKNQVAWNEEESLGPERLLLAELLLGQGQYQEAHDVAARFDTSLPLIYPLYLPASLEIRRQAAEAMGDSRGAARYRARLSLMSGKS